jgi:hypothetical protein
MHFSMGALALGDPPLCRPQLSGPALGIGMAGLPTVGSVDAIAPQISRAAVEKWGQRIEPPGGPRKAVMLAGFSMLCRTVSATPSRAANGPRLIFCLSSGPAAVYGIPAAARTLLPRACRGGLGAHAGLPINRWWGAQYRLFATFASVVDLRA